MAEDESKTLLNKEGDAQVTRFGNEALRTDETAAQAVQLETNNLQAMKMRSKGESQDSSWEEPASLDDAMNLTGFGLYTVLHVFLSGLILLGVIMQSLALGHVLPAARCDLGFTSQQTGLLASVPFAAQVLMSYIWGWMADVRGRRRVMLATMPVSVIFCLAASLAPELISFGVFVFFTAVFFSGPTAVIYTYLGELNSAQHKDKVVAFGSSFIGTGTVIIPVLSWLILPLDFSHDIPFLNISYRPWRLLYFACSLPHAIGSIILIFFPESPKYLYSQGREEESLAVIKKIYAINKWKAADSFPIKELIKNSSETEVSNEKKSSGIISILRSMKDQTVPLFKKPLLRWTCTVCFLQFGVFAATNGFFIWFPTFLNAMALDSEGSGICIALEKSRHVVRNITVVDTESCIDVIDTSTFEQSIYIGLVFTSMYFIVAFVVDFMGKRLLMMMTLVITGVAGAVSSHVASHIAVGLFAVLQMAGACVGLTNAVACDLFPTKYRALAICIAMLMGRAGSMVGSALIGLLLNVKCESAFYAFGGLLAVNGLCCLTLPGKAKSDKDVDINKESAHEMETKVDKF